MVNEHPGPGPEWSINGLEVFVATRDDLTNRVRRYDTGANGRMPPVTETNMSDHKFLEFGDFDSRTPLARRLAVLLTNYYAGAQLSRTQWLKRKQSVTVRWHGYKNDGNGTVVPDNIQQSKPITLKVIERHLINNRSFDSSRFGLPQPFCDWLDQTTTVSPNFHHVDSHGKTVMVTGQTPFGTKFPIKPALDREGVFVTSFHAPLLIRIKDLRQKLVANSNAPSQLGWITDLRELLSLAISLLDATLHQLYFIGMYSPPGHWPRFNPNKLGDRHGRRLTDKLAWVYHITGEFLNLSPKVKASINVVREVRNQLQHFDPPSFCFTMEDACRWMNQVVDVCEATLDIRVCAGAVPSVELIGVLLDPPVNFCARYPGNRRCEQPGHVGYRSTSSDRLTSPVSPSLYRGEGTVHLAGIPREPVFVERIEGTQSDTSTR